MRFGRTNGEIVQDINWVELFNDNNLISPLKNKSNEQQILNFNHPINKHKKLKTNRPSPSESATLFRVGITKKGNDDNIWIIVKNKNGVKRWKQYKH